MVKTVSSPSSLLAVLVAGVVALGVVWLLHLGHVEASSHSATRSFAPASVPAGGELEVTITASDYGGFWGVAETLSDGFTYVEGSVAPSDVRVREDGLTVNFTLLGGRASHTARGPSATGRRTGVRGTKRVAHSVPGVQRKKGSTPTAGRGRERRA